MTIKVVTDSACDLPEELARNLNITVVPLYIHVGEQTYRDGLDLSREDFYRKLPTWPVSPTTAAPGPSVFHNIYEKLASEGADEILSIHLSETLSLTVETARQGAELTGGAKVTVYDSGQLSLGAGLLAVTAARTAAGGASMSAILEMLESQAKRTHTFAALDTLEYLTRSGRMSQVVSMIGNLLQIKPLLRMHLGKATSEKVRTHRRAIERLMTILKSLAPFEKVALLHSEASARADELFELARAYLPEGETLRSVISPVLGAHIGPGVVGFVCITRS
ncbi:MAG: DegV family protein [Anaerolineaceae bacterium]